MRRDPPQDPEEPEAFLSEEWLVEDDLLARRVPALPTDGPEEPPPQSSDADTTLIFLSEADIEEAVVAFAPEASALDFFASEGALSSDPAVAPEMAGSVVDGLAPDEPAVAPPAWASTGARFRWDLEGLAVQAAGLAAVAMIAYAAYGILQRPTASLIVETTSVAADAETPPRVAQATSEATSTMRDTMPGAEHPLPVDVDSTHEIRQQPGAVSTGSATAAVAEGRASSERAAAEPASRFGSTAGRGVDTPRAAPAPVQRTQPPQEVSPQETRPPQQTRSLPQPPPQQARSALGAAPASGDAVTATPRMSPPEQLDAAPASVSAALAERIDPRAIASAETAAVALPVESAPRREAPVARDRESTESARPVVPDTRAIEGVLGRYRAAFSGLDASAARAVWPTVDSRALGRAFDGLEEQALAFEACEIAVSERQAVASCGGSARYVPKVGNRRPQTESRHWKFSLRKVDDQWLIEAVDAR
jgi:hypothetical protein